MKIFLIFLMLAGGINAYTQSYEVSLAPVTIDGLGGLQSYAVGTYQGEWLLVGGRLDGLHQRQPFAAFSADGNNQDLIVVNPSTKSVWRSPLSSLPTGIKEQLSSSNMQSYQSGNILLCTGGYGYSPSQNDHITYPYLTIIDLAETIQGVKNNTLNPESFSQFQNEVFRVTGGSLNKIENTYYLVGGHKFMGRYNPMGPDHGPGFEQEYTNEIRKFEINNGENMSLNILDPIHDEMQLHRRDYNLTPYISDGKRELMIYSGVFQTNADLPWLHPVRISKDGYQAVEDFTQYFNHYHCANLPIYDSNKDEMHTLFFGGIAQFYKENDILVQDNDIPFVNTIAEINQDESGALTETTLSESMPGYLGAGSVLILDAEAPLIQDDIIDGTKIDDNFTVIGHIYGGIRSSLPNIFWINTGQESEASNVIYQVAIKRINDLTSTTSVDKKEEVLFYPNPTNKLVRMSLYLDQPQELAISISDSMGRSIHQQVIKKENTIQGKNYFVLENVDVGFGAFFYTVKIGENLITRKVIWSE